MATTFLLPLSQLLAPAQALLGWLVARPAPTPMRPARKAAQRVVLPAAARPLRVLRVVEPSAPRTVAGRMVISGRLADVCAELDRLAAQEAPGH